MAAGDKSGSAAPEPAHHADWLPYTQQPLLSTKAMYTERFLHNHRHRDGILSLAWAMDQERGDGQQSKWLSKVDVFLCDFIPRGLTGDYAHIAGDDVMEALLCHNETTATRHKVAKQAHVAFADLERWMARGADWKEALQKARAEVDDQRLAGNKKKTGWKAPGLHSPAGETSHQPPVGEEVIADELTGMMAILVIAHPNDSKFKTKIGQLEIQWMMTQDRASLSVSGGFWKGINSANLYTVFSSTEVRETEVPLLADYTRILGADFPRCRKDIRPFLPPWTRGLWLKDGPTENDTEASAGDSASTPKATSRAGSHVEVRGGPESASSAGEPEDSDSTCEPTSPAHSVSEGIKAGGASDDVDQNSRRSKTPDMSPAEVQAMRALLSKDVALGPEEMEAWLFDRLAGNDPVLVSWCRHWEYRIDHVENVLQQAITRELFLQSIHRLHSLHLSGSAMGKAYMLADITDHRLGHPPQETCQKAVELLGGFHVYKSFQQANTLLSRYVEQASGQVGVDLMARLVDTQRCFFYDTSLGSHFGEVTRSIAWETIRTCILLQNVPDTKSAEAQRWTARYDILLTDKTITSMQLTNWQLRVLLFPGADCDRFVTRCQAVYFWQTIAQGASLAPDDPRLKKPVPVSTATVPTGSIRDRYQSLQKLFGDLVVQDPAIADFLTNASSTTFIEPRRRPASRPVEAARVIPAQVLPVTETKKDEPADPAPRTPDQSSHASVASTAPPDRPSQAASATRTPSKAVTPVAQLCFAGKTFVPNKRSASPDGRDPKKARVLGWREELKTSMEQLQKSLADEWAPVRADLASFRAEIKAFQDEVYTQVPQRMEDSMAKLHQDVEASIGTQRELLRSDLKADVIRALEASNARLRGDLTTATSSELGHLRSYLEGQVVQDLGSSIAKLKTETEQSMNAEFQGVRIDVQTLTSGLATWRGDMEQSMRAQLRAATDQLQAAFGAKVKEAAESLQEAAKAPPELGQDGFLRRWCPAPPGRDQAEHEAQLERAAWFYIFELGNPDDGVSEDEGAFDRTLARFPGLDEKGFSVALQHVHLRTYRRPFRQLEQGGQGFVEPGGSAPS